MPSIARTTPNTIVVIVGMHRSGTSLLTRLLNICGLYLGKPNELTGPSKGNELGHWENKKFVAINKQIISQFHTDGSLSGVPDFPSDAFSRPEVIELGQKAIKIIDEMNSRAPLWGWKDPRNCLTLPFWQKVLKKKGKVLYVVPLRGWLPVAQSLKKRDRLPFEESIDLWNNSFLGIYQHLPPSRTHYFLVDNLFNNSYQEIKTIGDFINSAHFKISQKEKKEIDGYVTPSMWHHKSQVTSDSLICINDFFINQLFTSNQYLINKVRKLTKDNNFIKESLKQRDQQLKKIRESFVWRFIALFDKTKTG